MITKERLANMSREEKKTYIRGTTPDSVIRALLAFLPDKFTSDYAKIHGAVLRLRETEEYKPLLHAFEPVPAPGFPYSPLLVRVFKRLVEARLLILWSPELAFFQMPAETRAAVLKRATEEFNGDDIIKLKEIADILGRELAVE